MVQPRQEFLGPITVLDEDASGTVNATGAELVNVTVVLNSLAVQPTTGAGAGAFWVQDGTPTIARFTDSAGTTITLNDAGTDANAIHDNASGEILAIPQKVIPDNDDVLIIEDSNDGYSKRRLAIGNLPGGSGGGETLEQTLAIGNTTGSNWILVENGYGINSAVDGDGVRLQAGGTTSGAMLISCGSNPAGAGGNLSLESGSSTSGGTGGGINVLAGPSVDVGLGGTGGSVAISAGAGDAAGGNVLISSGGGTDGNGGTLAIFAGASTTAEGGNATLESGDGVTGGGSLYLYSGDSVSGAGGIVSIQAGNADTGGMVNITSGDGVNGNGGEVYLGAGDSSNDGGGNVYITAGSGPTSGGYAQLIAGDGLVPGDITISAGLGDDGDYGDVLIRGNSVNIDTIGSSTEFKFNDGYLAVLGDREIRWYGGDGHYSGLQAPATGTNNIWLLPEDDGSSGNVLTTDGSGALYWSVGGGGGGGETLEQTLALGNTTGANWILVENGYGINSEVDGGGVRLLAGGTTSGTMLISCGSNPAGAGGNLVIESGSSTSGATGGGLDIRSGTSNDFGLGGIGGQIVMAAGAGEFAGGGILIASGEGTGGVGTSGGDIIITAGDGYTSGGVFISGGVDNDGYYGNILMTGNNINIDTDMVIFWDAINSIYVELTDRMMPTP